MEKPILFLDFDRTLFDTAQLYEWLGKKDEQHLLNENVIGPDFRSMLYPETLPFLQSARRTYFLVLLTSTANPSVQKKKINRSGIVPYLDDVIMIDGAKGDYSGKGIAVQAYLRNKDAAQGGHVFVDDLLKSVVEVKMLNPEVRCVWIDRARSGEEAFVEGLLPPDDTVANLKELQALL